jgi:hypothetical protein
MLDEREEQVRQYVRALRGFYQELLVSCVVLFVCLVIWFAIGGYFWPFWVFIGLGAKLIFQGLALAKLSAPIGRFWCRWFSFTQPEWEDKIVEKMMGRCHCCDFSQEKCTEKANNEESEADNEPSSLKGPSMATRSGSPKRPSKK